MSHDIVSDTATRLGIAPIVLFYRAAKEHEYTDATVTDRFNRYYKFGTIPEWVSDHCLTYWREHAVLH